MNVVYTFATDLDFLDNDIRVKPNLDALGALGDAGWYYVRSILWAADFNLPKSVTALPETVFNKAGFIMSCSAALQWEDGKVATFHCSFLANRTMSITTSGTKEYGLTELVTGCVPLPSQYTIMTNLPQEALMVTEFSSMSKIGVQGQEEEQDDGEGEGERKLQVREIANVYVAKKVSKTGHKFRTFKLRANIARFDRYHSRSKQGSKKVDWVFDIPSKSNQIPSVKLSPSKNQNGRYSSNGSIGINNRSFFSSKEDQALKISKSVFITNFPNHFTACNLLNVCLAYGNVIDVDIPSKKSKAVTGVTVSNSFAAVLKSGTPNPNLDTESSPAIVFDDSCIMERDFSSSLLGKIKDINALSNHYIILANEGFEKVKLSYLGGHWILLEMDSVASKEKIINHVGVGSCF
ncbi:uncharacterized oxidoreductase-like protein [Tanacetum coccineum]|uniref:Uncharacterized oxidoreductase-like protein n=1 Tax=Tanacetum coccineum TaxID=301880 RepID=A0ABQ5AUT3_9ASTR